MPYPPTKEEEPKWKSKTCWVRSKKDSKGMPFRINEADFNEKSYSKCNESDSKKFDDPEYRKVEFEKIRESSEEERILEMAEQIKSARKKKKDS